MVVKPFVAQNVEACAPLNHIFDDTVRGDAHSGCRALTHIGGVQHDVGVAVDDVEAERLSSLIDQLDMART